MIDWASAYEAPISLDAERLIGTRPKRQTFWTAIGWCAVPIFVAFVLLRVPEIGSDVPEWIVTLVTVLVPVGIIWMVICQALAKPWGPRPVEYWLRAWLRHRRIPRHLHGAELVRHHHDLEVSGSFIKGDFPRAVVEVDTINLSMTDADSLKGHIGKLHTFFVGLKFPVQIVVRAWQQPDCVERRWFVAVVAETEAVLQTRLDQVVAGLTRAGLGGRALNGDLFDTLQACWTLRPGSRLGPGGIQRDRHHVIVDGEYVKGMLLKKMPKFIDPNWLSAVLDGELPVDFSMWLDPIDNATELQYLTDRVNEWQAAQHLNVNNGRHPDPDIEDSIKDAARTRLFLKRHQLRVFTGSVGFVVRGDTAAKCQERERLLLDQLREQVGDDAVIPLTFEHDKAPMLAVPIGFPPIEYPLQIVSPAVAMSYPFSNSCINMPGGIECGTSLSSKRINRLDVLKLTNPHMIIPGTSGSGKGYWLKVYLYRLLLQFPERFAWIIQTEKDEYGALVDAMPQEPAGFSLTESRRRLIPEPNRRYFEPDPPRSRGAKITIRNLAEFDSMVWHIDNSIRRQPSGSQLTVYDLTKMPQDERGEAISRLLDAIRTQAASRPLLGYVAIDELGIVVQDKIASVAIGLAYRTFRSIPLDRQPSTVSRIGMIGLTQLPSDLLGHPQGAVYAKLAETGLYLRQQPSELEVTKRPLKLSQDEVTFLENAGDGDALLVAGRKRVSLHLQANPLEHSFART